MNRFRAFYPFFVAQTLAYGIVDCSYRWIAQGHILLSVTSAMVYALVAFKIIEKIADDRAKSRWAIAGYVCGSGVGTYLGIVASKAVTGV